MKLERNQVIKPFCTLETERPWGYFGLYADNVKSTTKILYIKKGESLSLQYHFKRSQYYLLLSDGFTIDYSSKPVPKSMVEDENEDHRVNNFKKFLEDNMITVKGNRGDMFGFLKRVIHKASYNGNDEYGLILDVAYGENDEEDVIRIQDQYNRETILK